MKFVYGYQSERNERWSHIRDECEDEPHEHTVSPSGDLAVVAWREAFLPKCIVSIRSAERNRIEGPKMVHRAISTIGKGSYFIIIEDPITGDKLFSKNFYQFDECMRIAKFYTDFEFEKAKKIFKK